MARQFAHVTVKKTTYQSPEFHCWRLALQRQFVRSKICRSDEYNHGHLSPGRACVHYFYLGIAIFCEVIATSALKAADGFKSLGPSLLVIVGYSAAFYFLSLTLRTIPVGIAYAIWSGVGQVFVMLIAWVLYRQNLDAPAFFGIGLILAGVLVLTLLSKSMPH